MLLLIQFRVVIHPPKSNIDRICDNIKDNVDISELKSIEFGKLTKEEKNNIEESIYAMMAKFKTTPLELDNTMPKELYSLIENKWHYCLNLEKEIRESTLANLFPKFKRVQITKNIQKCGSKFQPKHKAFNILQNNIEEAVQRTTQMWKII